MNEGTSGAGSAALKSIDKAIEEKWPKSTRISGDGVTLENIHAVLAAIQNPWRNATMHLEAKYTDEEAALIFLGVKGIMRTVAARCDEMGEPKV